MSEQYLVSARKYRPQTFDTVVGQEHITTTLKNAIRTSHLAHAYLFCGPRGVGKTTCARILARTINCESPTADMEACGVCATCKSFNDNTSFNVFELDAASNNSVDDIRELVNQVRFAPQQGRYKIYIIDEVHMLSASAFNAFLKTLEEPPPYAIFILATTEKHKILPTILSRCQIFDFKRITTADTVHHLQAIALKEGLTADETALHVIAQKSEGCMRDSLSMLDRIASFTGGSITYASTMEHLAMLDADFYFQLTDAMLSQDVSTALLQLDGVLEKGFEGNVVLEGLAEHFRNLLLCKDARMAKMLDVPGEHKKVYYDKAAQAPPSFILSALNVLNDSELNYRNATNKRLHTELCLIRLCYLLQATSAATTESGPQKKTDDSASVAPAGARMETPRPGILQQQQPVVQPVVPAPDVVLPVPVAKAETAPPPAPQPVLTVDTVEDIPTPVPESAPVIIPPAVNAPPVAQVEPPAAPPVPPAPAQPQPEGRRVSSSFLVDIDSALEAVSERKAEVKAICQEDAERMFDAFREKTRADGRGVLYAQLSMMQVECVSADEIRLVSPSPITDSYAQSLRNELIEVFSKEANGQVRVTTELREDESAGNQVQVLSKQEMYDVMAQKNPLVARLREGLNLQIDY